MYTRIYSVFTENIKAQRSLIEEATNEFQSPFLNLIKYFESMLAVMFRFQYTKYPESIGLKPMALTSKLIEAQVASTMKQGLDEWLLYFTKKQNLKLNHFQEIKSELVEIFARRDVFVNNAGRVNSIYINKVEENLRKGINIGDMLIVDSEYINKSATLIERFGILIILEIWYSQENTKITANEINIFGYDYIMEGNWKTACEIFNLIINDDAFNTLPQSIKMMTQINQWLCLKNLNTFDSVKDMVMKTDPSACDLRYQLPLLALQENYTTFFDLLPKVCPSEITLEEFQTWPVLNNVREQPEYEGFLAEAIRRDAAATEKAKTVLKFSRPQGKKIIVTNRRE